MQGGGLLVAERLADAPVRPVLLVSTDDDTTNLQAAVGLRKRLPMARVFVRWASETPFLRAMEAQHDLEGLGHAHREVLDAPRRLKVVTHDVVEVSADLCA